MNQRLWRFRDFELNGGEFTLRRAGTPVRLDPKPMELLALLLERGGAVVSHDDALRQVWGEDVFVDGEAAIYTAIKKIRKALGDAEMVETVSRRGYRLRVEKIVAIPLDSARPEQRNGERIAILPLINLAADPAQDYFSDGLTEELIATMGRMFRGQLGVIARTSVMRFKTVSRPIEEIATELGADYVIEGSVRRQNARVRIAVQLFRASDAASLWGETFERSTDDVFALQTEIALATAGAIRTTLITDDKAAVETTKHATVDPEIHDRYLRARHLWVQRTKSTIEAAIQYFRETLARDSKFAPAYAGLSCCYAILPITTNLRPKMCFPEAESLAMQALAIDPSQSEAQIALGLVEFWYRRNWDAALRYFRHAAALNPSDPSGAMFLAHVYSVLGQHDLALSTIASAQRIDPLSPIVATHVGHFFYNAGKFEEALASLAKVLEANPHFWIAHLMQGKALASLGSFAEAIEAFKLAQKFGPANTEALGFRIFTLAQSGDRSGALSAWEEMEALHRQQTVSPVHRALARLGLDDRDSALALLEAGLDEHDVRLVFIGVEARWQELGEPEYRRLLGRVGLDRTD